MRRIRLALALGLCSLPCLALPSLAQTPAPAPQAQPAPGQARATPAQLDINRAPSGQLEIDPNHTEVDFTILRGGLVTVRGRFDKVSGSLNFNPTDPTASTVSFTIDTNSVSMMAPGLNEELKMPAAFNVAQFGQASFVSTRVMRTSPNSGYVVGNMTIKGVTKEVVMPVTWIGTDGNQMGFHAQGNIRRSDFDMTGMRYAGILSDDVQIVVDALFRKPGAR